jgi:hypothetical protein
MNLDGLSSAEETKLARAILQYLSLHPEAKDTEEGITTWWLQGQRIERTMQVFSKVLEVLVARGFILKCRGPDRRPYYKLNPQRLAEIVHLVGGSEP